MRKLVLTLTGILLLLSLSATGDSLNYLTAKDTVFLKLDDFGNNIFGHQLAKGQTMYSLARFYGLKIEVLYGFNPSIEPGGAVPPEQTVNLPVPDSAIVDWNLAWPRTDFVPVFYTVKHGDTFFKVAKTYFNKSLDTLKMRNRLVNTTLSTGQRLQIGWLSTGGIPEAMQSANRNPFGLKMQQLQMTFEQEKGTKKPQF
ncbi:MAG: LysM peptidoglycan-binding domain-containing protein, partial [Bacteroidetes bacterium]|nr:LysM peptidoglycan-binding domain-containing protein [Bacteroidota bacterium]